VIPPVSREVDEKILRAARAIRNVLMNSRRELEAMAPTEPFDEGLVAVAISHAITHARQHLGANARPFVEGIVAMAFAIGAAFDGPPPPPGRPS
jgi:hypothetical protein